MSFLLVLLVLFLDGVTVDVGGIGGVRGDGVGGVGVDDFVDVDGTDVDVRVLLVFLFGVLIGVIGFVLR